jgi:hypothetical protein
MSKEKPSIEDIKLNNKEDSKEVNLYGIVPSGYGTIYTEDKDAAYKVWSLLTEKFFVLKNCRENVSGLGYNDPEFNVRKHNTIKLEGKKTVVWISEEKATMAASSFKILKDGAEKRKEVGKEKTPEDLPF